MSYPPQNAPNLYPNAELFMYAQLGPPSGLTTCSWATELGQPCGVMLPMNQNIVSMHLRNHHALGGDSKETLTCFWGNCPSRPIQKRSLIRHILSVHLCLLRWTCPLCSKTFARRGTAHRCYDFSHPLPHA